MQEYARFPMVMHHPAYRAADVVDASLDWKNRMGATVLPGRPTQFPPVTVHNADQEAYYESRGYAPNGSPNPQAFVQQQAAPVPPGFSAGTYPRWEDGRLIGDPSEEPKSNEYPKWIGDGVVNSRAEEAAIRGALPPAPVAAEMEECLSAWEAAAAHSDLSVAVTDEREGLLRMADELQVPVDRRWKTPRIREALEAATTA